MIKRSDPFIDIVIHTEKHLQLMTKRDFYVELCQTSTAVLGDTFLAIIYVMTRRRYDMVQPSESIDQSLWWKPSLLSDSIEIQATRSNSRQIL